MVGVLTYLLALGCVDLRHSRSTGLCDGLGCGDFFALRGNNSRTDSGWVAAATFPSANLLPIYGISGELTAVVPEPIAFGCLGLFCLGIFGLRRTPRLPARKRRFNLLQA